MRILVRGGSALDAVEACAKIIEADPTDTSVGRGGKPNVLGEVELDASIVDGTTHRTGAGEAPASIRRRAKLLPVVRKTVREERGTVNFLALDARGDIASAVTTSGWAYKYPGRVGDSPIVGAGNYCDTRYGAAACTGYGEL